MRPYLIATLLAAVLLTIIHQSTSQAEPPKPSMTKGDVEAIVKEYLINNPEVVVDALDAYSKEQERLEQEAAKKAIEENKESLFNNPLAPSIGPADADVVIAEFFDYHCGYCKRMIPVINKLMEDDKKVRVVFHELPILSKDSRLAAKAALAVYQLNPKQYFAYHTVLMKASGKYTKEMLTKEAVKLGVDKAKFTDALDMKQLDNALKSSKELASKVGISGTPAFVIGDELIPGASSLERIKKIVAKQRKANAAKN